MPMGKRGRDAGTTWIEPRIDAVSTWIGQHVAWLIVIAAIISAGNAIVRKLFDTSSNAWLEVAVVAVRSWRSCSPRPGRSRTTNTSGSMYCQRTVLAASWRNIIEIVGHVFFLLPPQHSSSTRPTISPRSRGLKTNNRKTPAACRNGRSNS